MKAWQENHGMFGGVNYLLEGDDPNFFISYNPNPGCGISIFGSDDESAETALVVRNKGSYRYFILNGDFRHEYEKVLDSGLAACMAVYDKNKAEHDSSWTT